MVRLSRVNTVLVVVIVAINLFVLVTPLWPAFMFARQKTSPKAQAITKQVQTPAHDTSAIAHDAQALLVPSMVLDAPIHEGASIKTLNQGLWRIPHSSTPDKGSNTVIVAHRFTYVNPQGTFYHLDKVKPNDQIAVLWHGKKYVYTVTGTKRVSASETSVEAPTSEPTLTLYTCTPLWNPKDRLVVQATLQEISP